MSPPHHPILAAVPDRVQLRAAPLGQPQRRDLAGHGDQRGGGRHVALLHLPPRAHAQEPPRLRGQLRRAAGRPGAAGEAEGDHRRRRQVRIQFVLYKMRC